MEVFYFGIWTSCDEIFFFFFFKDEHDFFFFKQIKMINFKNKQ